MYTTALKISDILKTEYPDFCEFCEASGKVFVSELSNADFAEFRAISGNTRAYIETIRELIDKAIDSSFDADFPIDDPLYKVWGVDPADYESMSFDDLELSVRSFNCLRKASCSTISDILKKSVTELRSIRNLGSKSCYEIIENVNTYIAASRIIPTTGSFWNTPLDRKLNETIREEIEKVLMEEEVSLDGLSKEQICLLEKLKNAVDTVGSELCLEAYLDPRYLSVFCGALKDFASPILSSYYAVEAVREKLYALPPMIKERKAIPFIRAYKSKTGVNMTPVLSNCKETTQISQIEIDPAYLKQLNGFVSWLDFDLSKVIGDLTEYEDETDEKIDENDKKYKRAKEILELRANGRTLQEIADRYGITRQWVQQIEKKAYRRFWNRYDHSKYDLIMLTYALRDGDTVLYFDELKEVLGEFAIRLWNAIIFIPNHSNYHYSKERNAIIVDKCEENDRIAESDSLVEKAHPYLYRKLLSFAESKQAPCTISEIMAGISYAASEKVVVETLQSVSWAEELYEGRYLFSVASPSIKGQRMERSNEQESAVLKPLVVQDNWIRYDSTNASDFVETIPAYVSIGETNFEEKNWARILVAIVEHELSRHNPLINDLSSNALFPSGRIAFFRKYRVERMNYSKLSNGYWINLNHAIPVLLQHIYEFCLHCGYSKDKILLFGEKKATSDKPKKSNERTILDAVLIVLREAKAPMTIKQIHQAILDQQLYHFNTSNSIGLVYVAVHQHCLPADSIINHEKVTIVGTIDKGHKKYQLLSADDDSVKALPKNASEETEKTSEPTDDQKDRFVSVLLQRYRNGMMFDSIDFDIFRETYEMLFDEQLPFTDPELEQRLRFCGVFYQERLFPADGIIDPETGQKLFAYIDNSFASGKTVLYYKAIYDDLASDFASCYTLADEEMLKAYIKYTAEKGKYCFFEKYMSVDQNVTIDHNKEVADFLLSAGKPMTIEAVVSALSHIPQEQVQSIIYLDDRFLRNAKGEYFHKDIFEASDEELDAIAAIINRYIAENEYAIWTDVWNQINEEMPAFVENNLYLSWLGVRNALAQRFAGRLCFSAAVISLPKDQFDMKDIYQLFAKHHVSFSADDVYHLSKDLDTVIYFEALAEVSVRVSHDLFVSADQIAFDIDAIDQAIGSFMAKDYICIREIDSFLSFPDVGYQWNEYLLESYVLSFSRKFTLVNNGMALHNVAGVIIKRGSPYTEFLDACAAILADSDVELKKDAALNYLADQNVITQRRYKNIELVLQKASQIRARRG